MELPASHWVSSLILTSRVFRRIEPSEQWVHPAVLARTKCGQLETLLGGRVLFNLELSRTSFHKRSSCSASRTRADFSEVQSLPPVRYTRSGMDIFKVYCFSSDSMLTIVLMRDASNESPPMWSRQSVLPCYCMSSTCLLIIATFNASTLKLTKENS